VPVENFYPISGATHDLPAANDAWTNNGGANKNASARPGGGRSGPATHDDDTTYVNAVGGIVQALNVDWPSPMLALNGVMHLSFRHRLAAVGPSNRVARFVNAAGTASASSPCDVNDNNSSYADTTSADIGAGGGYRPGGGAWVLTDFDDEQTIFIQLVNTGGAVNTRVTSVWGDIDYQAAGGFVFMLGLAGLGALPLAGALDFGHFLRFLSWRRRCHPRHTILTGVEVRQAWDELRAYRHPRYFLPA
jgi:hypothetical protein